MKNFKLYFWLILLFAAVLRLPGFDQHYLLAGDTAKDILVARGAVTLGQLPWVGSFSSAGPFVFGPNWYWYLMFSAIIAPNFYLMPWVIIYLLSLLFVFIMGQIGKALGGKEMGLITAFLTAFSPIVINNSFYLTQHGTIAIFAGLALLGMILYLKTGRILFAFLMGVAIGGGCSMHYQAMYLFVYLPVTFFGAVYKRKSIKELLKLIFATTVGLVIFPLPLFMWDASREFKNTIQLVYFYREGQYRFWVSNRWLTYLGVFWPQFLSNVSGGNTFFSTAIALVGILTAGIAAIKRKISLEMASVLVIFAIQLFMLRYFRGEKYDGYLVYFHPILLIISAWAFYQVVRFNRLAGVFLLIISLGLSMITNMKFYTWHNDVDQLFTMSDVIHKKFPNEKFTVYGRTMDLASQAYTLSWALDVKNMDEENGMPIGVCLYDIVNCGTPGATEITRGNFQGSPVVIANLSRIPQNEISKEKHWYPYSKWAVYDDVQNWWKKGL